MKRILLVVAILFVQYAYGQNCARRDDSVTTAMGQAIAGASVSYYAQSGIGQTASPTLANTYSDPLCTVTQNPSTTDGHGQAFAYMAPGYYTITYSAPAIQTQTTVDQVPAGTGAGSYSLTAAEIIAALSSPSLVAGTNVTITGAWPNQTINAGASGGSMTWPPGGAGVPNYTGSNAWDASYSSVNPFPANLIPGSIASNTSGTAASASALTSAPTRCPVGQAPDGIDVHGNAIGCQYISPVSSGALPTPPPSAVVFNHLEDNTFSVCNPNNNCATGSSTGIGEVTTTYGVASPSLSGTSLKVTNSSGSGTVNTSGTAVTWVSGVQFNTGWAGQPIKINSGSYTISSVTDATHLTLTATAGTQSGVAYLDTGQWNTLWYQYMSPHGGPWTGGDSSSLTIGNITNLVYDISIYPIPGANLTGYEFDPDIFKTPYRYVMSVACYTTGAHDWRVYDSGGGGWIATGIPCSLDTADINAWNRLQWWVTIDQTAHTYTYQAMVYTNASGPHTLWSPSSPLVGIGTYNAGSASYNELNVQFQIDNVSGQAGTSTAYYDNFSLTAWTGTSTSGPPSAVSSVDGRTGDITIGTADVPNNAANTSGTAAGLSGTPALPNGTTATTQAAGSNDTKPATDAYVDNRSSHQVTTPLNCADTSGFGTTQACTTVPSFTPTANDCIIYTTTTANTGTGLTLNVNGLGAKSVAKWQGTTTLAANDVLANKQELACYDGTNWELSTIGNPPAVSGLPTLPTAPNGVPQILTSTPSGGVGGAAAFGLSGIAGRTVSGSSDTVAATDRATWIAVNYASAVAESLPSAASFGSNFVFGIKNTNTGAVTITPTTSTIDGNSTLVVAEGQNCTITSLDNVNYVSRCAPGQITAGGNVVITPGPNGISIASVAGGSGNGLVAAPSVAWSPAAGTYSSTQSVTPSCTYGALEYNITGSAPVLTSTPISVTTTETINAGCYGFGYTTTPAGALYTITTGHTFTFVQSVAGAACTAGTATCSITVASTGTGNVGVLWANDQTGTPLTITSISGGGTWTIPSGCSLNHASIGTSNCAFIPSLTGGVTTITVTWSNATLNSNLDKLKYFEYSVTGGGGVVLDTSGTIFDSSSGTSQPGVALTLSGSSDLILQSLIASLGTVSGVTTYGHLTPSSSGYDAAAELLNTASGTAPTWTTTSSGTPIGAAIALK